MQMQNDLWQGYSGYWQNRFIHHHGLILGYIAWSGYLHQGRGLVVCDVVGAISPAIDWNIDTVAFHQTFIPQGRATKYLEVLELNHESVRVVSQAIATYEPSQSIVVLVTGNRAVDINLLHNLAISPPECYNQLQQRWAEFQPDPITLRRCP
jgi:hypothetical protein